jgi:hypothetical protein
MNETIFITFVLTAALVGLLAILTICGGTYAVFALLLRAFRAAHRRRHRRFARHVQAAIDARLVQSLEPVTEVLDLRELEAAFRHSPLHEFYLDPEETR